MEAGIPGRKNSDTPTGKMANRSAAASQRPSALKEQAVEALLGEDYLMHAHRHLHERLPGEDPTDQDLHVDNTVGCTWAERYTNEPWMVIGFYYPEDTTLDMGPTAVVGGTHLLEHAVRNDALCDAGGRAGRGRAAQAGEQQVGGVRDDRCCGACDQPGEDDRARSQVLPLAHASALGEAGDLVVDDQLAHGVGDLAHRDRREPLVERAEALVPRDVQQGARRAARCRCRVRLHAELEHLLTPLR